MKVFKDYAEVNEKIMEGYTVAAVTTGINEGETGMLLELERKGTMLQLALMWYITRSAEKMKQRW